MKLAFDFDQFTLTAWLQSEHFTHFWLFFSFFSILSATAFVPHALTFLSHTLSTLSPEIKRLFSLRTTVCVCVSCAWSVWIKVGRKIGQIIIDFVVLSALHSLLHLFTRTQSSQLVQLFHRTTHFTGQKWMKCKQPNSNWLNFLFASNVAELFLSYRADHDIQHSCPASRAIQLIPSMMSTMIDYIIVILYEELRSCTLAHFTVWCNRYWQLPMYSAI